jgi:hypothetical protein
MPHLWDWGLTVYTDDSSPLLSILAEHAQLGSSHPEQAMRAMLDALLEQFECDRAWLLYPCDPSALSWSVPIERTTASFPGAKELGVALPMTPEARDLFVSCLQSGRPVPQGSTSRDTVPADVQRAFQVKAQLSVLVTPKYGSPWLLGLHHCRGQRDWTEQEIDLFFQAGHKFAESLTKLVNLRCPEGSLVEDHARPAEAQLDCSLSGRIEQASPSVSGHLGYRPDALVGRSILHFFSSPLERAVAWTRISETGSCPPQEINLVSASGEEVPCLFSASLDGDTIQILLRRLSETESHSATQSPTRTSDSTDRVLGMLRLDSEGYRVSVDRKSVHLTETEFSLLTILTEQPGRVVSRVQLLERIWGVDFSGATRTVDSHIRNLRRKLKEAKPNYNPIRSVRGVGYSFEIGPS